MIVNITKEGNTHRFDTNGCGCCSAEYYLSKKNQKDKTDILRNLKQNIEVIKVACKALNVTYDELLVLIKNNK